MTVDLTRDVQLFIKQKTGTSECPIVIQEDIQKSVSDYIEKSITSNVQESTGDLIGMGNEVRPQVPQNINVTQRSQKKTVIRPETEAEVSIYCHTYNHLNQKGSVNTCTG